MGGKKQLGKTQEGRGWGRQEVLHEHSTHFTLIWVILPLRSCNINHLIKYLNKIEQLRAEDKFQSL